MERDQDTGLYVMSVAAELAGLHPQTLRLYERKGLLEPARSEGGNRRYSDRDLARLGRIGELTAAGINLEGVRRILMLEDENQVLRDQLERARAQMTEAQPPAAEAMTRRDARRDAMAGRDAMRRPEGTDGEAPLDGDGPRPTSVARR